MTRADLSSSSSSSSDAYPAAPVSPPCAAVEDRLQGAVQQLIRRTGDRDWCREGLRATPLRVAKAWREATRGQKHDVRSALGGGLFQEEIVNQGQGGLVLVRDISFASTSEHTLLPFFGKCHVGYHPANGVVLGLSKAARLAEQFSRKIQSQQQFTQDLLACLVQQLQPFGAAVCVVAQHLGPSPVPELQVTTASTGAFQSPLSPALQEFMCVLRMHQCVPCTDMSAHSCHVPQLAPPRPNGLNRVLLRNGKGGTVRLPDSVPQSCGMVEDDPDVLCRCEMEQAVETILMGIGESPRRQGLAGSVSRYVSFLQEATAGYAQEPSLLLALAAAASAGPRTHHSVQDSPQSLQHVHTRFASLCEHHLLPFQGMLRIALCPLPGLGRSAVRAAVQQLVGCQSRRLQIQERLTHEVADALVSLSVQGSVLVVCDAVHMCMVARGVEQHASATLTYAARGTFEADAAARADALQQAFADETPCLG